MADKWEIVAHDYHSPYARTAIWLPAVLQYPKINFFNFPEVKMAIDSYQDDIAYWVVYSSWRTAHNVLIKKVRKDIGYLEKNIAQIVKLGKDVNNFTAPYANKDLSSLSNEKLVKIYRQYSQKQTLLYTWGITLVFLDFDKMTFVSDELKKYLQARVKPALFDHYWQIFTTPLESSFTQQQEIALLKIYQRCKSLKIKTVDFDKLPAVIKRLLVNHARRWGWVYYVYAGPAYQAQDFWQSILDYHKKKIDPQRAIQQIINEKKKIKIARRQALKKIKPTPWEKRLLNLASQIVLYKPRRKDYQSISYWHMENVQKEMARRLGLTLRQVRSLPLDDIAKGLKTGRIDVQKANEIYRHHLSYVDNNKIKFLFGLAADKFVKSIKTLKQKPLPKNNKKISGACAFPGKAVGRVVIINKPEEMSKMKEGYILVSRATTPSIVPAIKKAAAIITNEGGLTCHAAIVSREFKIPCVVGTSYAADVLKDGDRVEVDANKGLVIMLK